MAQKSASTSGSDGPDAPRKTRYPRGAGSPHELAQRIEALEQAAGSKGGYFNVVGANSQGDPNGKKTDGLGQPLPQEDQYPVRLYNADPYDTTAQMKYQLSDSLGKKVLTTDDMDWLRRKADQKTAANFKQFVASMYNKNDPAQAALLNRVYPELLDEQKQILEDRMDLIKRLAVMKLYGQPQSAEDLQLLFAISSGAVAMPTGNLWEPGSWKGAFAGPTTKNQDINRGLFSAVKIRAPGVADTSKIPFDELNAMTGGGVGGSRGTPLGITADSTGVTQFLTS